MNIERLIKCEVGCNYFSNGEVRHQKTCPNYPESLSEMIDNLQTGKFINDNCIYLSYDSKMFWAWIVQREYKYILECYLHVEDEFRKIALEKSLIITLDEYNRAILGRSLAHQIELNKRSKMCDPDLPSLFDRYPDLFPKVG